MLCCWEGRSASAGSNTPPLIPGIDRVHRSPYPSPAPPHFPAHPRFPRSRHPRFSFASTCRAVRVPCSVLAPSQPRSQCLGVLMNYPAHAAATRCIPIPIPIPSPIETWDLGQISISISMNNWLFMSRSEHQPTNCNNRFYADPE